MLAVLGPNPAFAVEINPTLTENVVDVFDNRTFKLLLSLVLNQVEYAVSILLFRRAVILW